ncbi:TIGR03619 family F420-dependent LLM class oxidoreductase [Saccharothrix coeruleofusca]|uniref:LLM class F420-dependent oxidoreductase n=1 Tax=Saccharothrix coeruleofusca TaxID=33919 RepID=A0A918AJ53_9PSEU|nr:TIGR03619 family F420-dependent LLM class oxidoreductase [Saccharothrix coeruleofusca]GGP44933.1 LLM class F420-dependent oxidoreductase [Saccharothrix coeruleofusca]
MKLGIMLPVSGVHASPANITTIALAAERLGYDSLWTYERLLRPMAPLLPGPDGELERIPDIYRVTFEPLQTLSHVAALTSRIALGTNIVNPLFHPPVVLARRYATLDQFSDGRVIAGFGQGWMAQEFAAAAVPMKRRGAGFDEVIAAIRACWGPDPVEYAGRFYAIEASEINPKPVRGDIPIVIGANTDGGIDRAARIAEGISPIAWTLDGVVAHAIRFRTTAEKVGRNPAALTVTAQTNHSMRPKPISGDRPFLAGSPQQLAEDIERLREQEIDGVLFAFPPSDDMDTQIEMLEELRALVPAATGAL